MIIKGLWKPHLLYLCDMRAYSLMGFLSKPIHTIIENEEDFAFEFRNSNRSNSLEAGKLISSIKIPLIQRDYAQGRKSNLTLRNEFLKNIFHHLNEDKELKLDFIYGSLKKDNNENSFLPLDGQQRLTTLFLLHWYVIKKEGHQEENREELESVLTRFTYETRDTSRRFFSNLAEFNFEGNPKEEIEKAYWFSNYFKLDPTVSSVLNTLESIHNLYNEPDCNGNLLKKLDRIVFYVLPMDQFRLTDDLYIKLNARGKVLSSFENFKADIIGFIKKYNKYKKENHFSGMQLYHYDIISNKFDNKWADFFWQKAKDDEGKKSIDSYFFKFIHKVLINEYIVAFSEKDLLKDEVYNSLLDREKKLNYSTFDFYKQPVFFDLVERIEIILDFYVEHSVEIVNNIQPAWNPDFNWNIFKADFTMDDRMLFDAVNHYALNNQEFNLGYFKDWIRIVWNIIVDPDIRSIGVNKTAMTFVREISLYSSDILRNLDNGILDHIIENNKSIYGVQLKEEKEKASRILDQYYKTHEWSNIITEAEKHPLFLGNISFLLQDFDTPDLFSKRLSIATKLFNANGATELLSNGAHSLFRYVVSQFTNIDEIKSINYRDDFAYWQLLLRRKNYKKVQLSIFYLCGLLDKDAVKNEILANIKVPSTIEENRLIHDNLYFYNDFVAWYLENRVDVLWYYSDHLYINKYNDKSGNRVQIDTFRNELITKLLLELNFTTESMCGKSNFYKGKNIECDLYITNDIRLTVEFTEYDNIIIGIWSEYILELKDPNREDTYWIIREKIEKATLSDKADVDNIFESIKLIISKPDFLCPTNTQKTLS